MPNSAPQAPGQITVTDAYDRARAGEAVLLDVREADEYSAGHAPGSTWQPLTAIAAERTCPKQLWGGRCWSSAAPATGLSAPLTSWPHGASRC